MPWRDNRGSCRALPTAMPHLPPALPGWALLPACPMPLTWPLITYHLSLDIQGCPHGCGREGLATFWEEG